MRLPVAVEYAVGSTLAYSKCLDANRAVVFVECLRRSFRYHFTGTSTGAPLFLTKNTTNFAGLLLLAFRPTT